MSGQAENGLPTPPRSGRIASIDFWRGVVLLMIFVDHVDGNPFWRFTFRNYSFADAAEAFVFLSGLVLAYVCWPSLTRGDFFEVFRRCIRRSAQLYGVHLALTFGAVVLFGLGMMLGASDTLAFDHNHALAFGDPGSAFAGTLVLGYQIGFFNILPVYVVMMLMAPLLLWLLSRSILAALIVSTGIYMIARLGYWPPNWPGTFSWFLNPFAWQLLFTLGMAAGIFARQGGIARSRPLIVASAVVTVIGAVCVSGLVTVDWNFWEPYLDLDKGLLGVGRLVNFLAVAYLVSQFRLGDRLLRIPGMVEVARLGRQSLSIFAAGSILSAVAMIILSFPQVSANPLAFQLVAMFSILVGAAVQFGLARYLEWRQASVSGRVPGVLGARG